MAQIPTSEEILQIFRSGNAEQRIAIVKSCPASPMQEGALLLAGMENAAAPIMTLDALSNSYSFGRACELGAEISRAGHQLAKEAYEAQGPEGPILLLTVSRLAANLITALNLSGKFGDAVEFADEVIPYYEELGDEENISSIRVGKISALIQLNEIDEAKKLVIEEKNHQGKKAPDLSRLEKQLDDLMRSPGELAQKPREQKDNESSTSGGAESASGTGKLYHDMLREVLDAGGRALGVSGGEMNEWKAKKIIRDAGSIFLDETAGQDPETLRQSLDALATVREWTKEHGARIDDCDALWSMYICHKRLDEISEAADTLQALRQNIEDIRAGIGNPMERGGVASNFPHLFPSLCQMLSRSNRNEELLDAMEGAKGRAVADILAARLDTVVHERELSEPAGRLPQLMQTCGSHYLSFFVDDEETYAVLVGKDGSIHGAGSIPLKREQIRAAAKNADPGRWGKLDLTDPARKRRGSASETLSPLFSWLEPHLDSGLLEQGDHICYSPDEHLHQIPLHYVHFRGEALVRSFSVSRTHGAHALALILEKEPVEPDAFTSIEVPARKDLKYAETLEDLGRLPAWLAEHLEGDPVSGEEATPDALAAMELKDRVVHFATHGTFPKEDSPPKDANPFHSSGLVLAGEKGLPDLVRIAKGEDREHLLTPERALELGLDFSGSHVTMQACVSGLALEGIGGDALGLEWALIQAGAVSLLSSHWYVRAQLSSEFITRFYGHWLTNRQTRAKAWRETVLELADSDGPLSEPHSWAAFSLSGDWR